MKKYLLAIVAVAATLVSCQKNDNPTPEKKGVPMTLKASINNDGTKVTYTPGATSGLKVDWEATENISILTINNSGEVQALDNFTSTGAAGRSEATFTGTFTGGSDPYNVIAIYPALEEYTTGCFGTPEYTRYDGADTRLLWDMWPGGDDKYFASQLTELKQTADNGTTHLQNVLLMAGYVNKTDIKSNTLTVTLGNQLSIIKFDCTFDDALKGQTLNSIVIQSKNSSDANKAIFNRVGTAWDHSDLAGNPLHLGGGESRSDVTIYADFAVPASGKATLYLPVVFTNDNVTNDYWNITVRVNDTDRPVIKKTFTADKTYQRGKIYKVELAVN